MALHEKINGKSRPTIDGFIQETVKRKKNKPTSTPTEVVKGNAIDIKRLTGLGSKADLRPDESTIRPTSNYVIKSKNKIVLT